jgi:hypothetical protein
MTRRISAFTDAACLLLEEAETGPQPKARWNPGTIWALSRRGLIADGPLETVQITQAGIEALRALARVRAESITHLESKPT